MPENDYINSAINTITQIHENEENGDILVFLTGEDEIGKIFDELNQKLLDSE